MGINYVDIIIIALAAIFCIVGFCTGFLRSLTKLMGSFLSLIAAIFLCKPVTMLICSKTPLDDLMINGFTGWFSNLSPVMSTPIGSGGLDLIKDGLTSSGIPNFLVNWIAPALVKLIPAGTEQTIAVLLAGYLTQAILLVCSTILLFAIIRTIIYFVNKLIALFLKDKLLKLVDRIFGIAFGLLKTMVVVFALFAIGSYFLEKPYAQPVYAQIQSGTISSVMYNNNPVRALIDRYLNLDDILNQIKQAIGGKQQDDQQENGTETSGGETQAEARIAALSPPMKNIAIGRLSVYSS